MDPKVTAHPWPTKAIPAALAGEKPSMMSSGAETATGTPKPVMPWIKLEKPQPMSSAWVRRSSASLAIARPMASMPFSLSTMLNM